MDLTGTPTAVSGLSEAIRYSVQNTGDNPVYLKTASTAPTDPGGAFILRPYEWAGVRLESGESLYAWTTTGAEVADAIAVDEAG